MNKNPVYSVFYDNSPVWETKNCGVSLSEHYGVIIDRGEWTMDTMYPKCGLCEKGTLLPVNMGNEGERSIMYRCTNKDCNVCFNEHGYRLYDEGTHEWVPR